MADFWVEMMNEDNTRVHPEWIRVSLRLVGSHVLKWPKKWYDIWYRYIKYYHYQIHLYTLYSDRVSVGSISMSRFIAVSVCFSASNPTSFMLFHCQFWSKRTSKKPPIFIDISFPPPPSSLHPHLWPFRVPHRPLPYLGFHLQTYVKTTFTPIFFIEIPSFYNCFINFPILLPLPYYYLSLSIYYYFSPPPQHAHGVTPWRRWFLIHVQPPGILYVHVSAQCGIILQSRETNIYSISYI